MTLPLVSVLVIIAWLLLPSVSIPIDAEDYGLWSLLPTSVTEGWVGRIVSLAITSIAVYIIAELNNTHALLRISSRMISSVFAFFLGILVCFHTLQPAVAIMLIVLLSYTVFFQMYQSFDPVPPFYTFLILSIASLFLPKLLVLVVIYWLCMIYMRAFSFRSFVSTLIGFLLPYWILVSVAYVLGEYDLINNFYRAFTTYQLPDYSVLTFPRLLMLVLVFIFYLTGTVDFYVNSFLDKTRTRITYNVLVFHGVYILITLFAIPQYFFVWLALFTIDAAILFGHFVALTYNRFSHIYVLVLLAMSIAVLVVQTLNITIALPWSH